MASTTVYRRFTDQKLVPAMDQPFAMSAQLPINLAPGLTIPFGTLMVPPTGTGASDVQTITAPGSLTYTLSGVNPLTGVAFTTTALAFGANDAAVQAALNTAIAASGPGSVTVASLAVTFAGALANLPIPLMTIATAGSGSPAVVHTTVGSTGGTWTVYPGTTGTPGGIMIYSVITDTSANISFASQTGGGEHGEVDFNAPVFTRGFFKCSELVGLDANAVAKMFARNLTIAASTTAGVLYIP